MLTTAYHPQSNDMVERVHRQLKDALRARGAGPAWHSHLPWVLMGLRAAPKEDSAVSSVELVTGTPLVHPGQLLHVPDPPRVDVPPPPTRLLSYAAAANSPPAHLAKAEHVYVRVGGQQTPGGPICRPIPGGFQRSKDLHHPGGPAAGDRVSGQAEASHRPGSSLSC